MDLKRKKDVILRHWMSNLMNLKETRDKYDLLNLLEVQGRCIPGIGSREFIDEAVYTITELVKKGYLQLEDLINNGGNSTYWGVSFENITFAFTDKFDDFIKEQTPNNNVDDKEILKLSPELYGIGIDLKALWRKIYRFFKKK